MKLNDMDFCFHQATLLDTTTIIHIQLKSLRISVCHVNLRATRINCAYVMHVIRLQTLLRPLIQSTFKLHGYNLNM